MVHGSWHGTQVRFTVLILTVFLMMVGVVSLQPFQASSHAPSPVATYSQGLLRVTIPYHALHTGAGQFTVEVLNPEDQVLGRTEQRVEVTERRGQLQSEVKLEKSLAVDDLVCNTAEIALNVERYVLPKFKVAVEFNENGKKQKRGYQPGDRQSVSTREDNDGIHCCQY